LARVIQTVIIEEFSGVISRLELIDVEFLRQERHVTFLGRDRIHIDFFVSEDSSPQWRVRL
jgi:hypothetical protein